MPAQHAPSSAPEPVEWRPSPPLRERLLRATAVPLVAGIAVFVAAVIVAIVLTVTRGHDAAAEEIGELSSQSDGAAVAPGSGSGSGSGSSPADSEGEDRDSAPETVLVHVVGEVSEPGVVEVPAGARVSEAIERAGGATSEAVLAAVNLARAVVDGEQIVVPDQDGAERQAVGSGGTGAGGPEGAGGGGAGEAGGEIVNLNTANAAALETLPRIGPALAQRIIDWRESNGGFSSVEQLMEVSGVGAKIFEALRPLVTV